MDARLSVYPTSWIRFDFYLNNLFDKQHFTYGAPVDPDWDGIMEAGYFVQPPRNFYGKLVLTF
jgi:outer membrane receptor protein involved in Fe transport